MLYVLHPSEGSRAAFRLGGTPPQRTLGRERRLRARSNAPRAALRRSLRPHPKLSHQPYWQPEENPDATNCLLYNAPNANHPNYDVGQDSIQRLTIRQHTMDGLTSPYKHRMGDLMNHAGTDDLEALLVHSAWTTTPRNAAHKDAAIMLTDAPTPSGSTPQPTTPTVPCLKHPRRLEDALYRTNQAPNQNL